MFKEFLQDRLFTARFLLTDWSEVFGTSTQIGHSIPESKIREAGEHDFHNIVIGGQMPLGYVRTQDIRVHHELTASNLKRFEDWSIDSTMCLPQFADTMLKYGTDSYPLFFICDDQSKPLGVATYADLNRRSCYIYTYTLVNFIEQWIKKRIILNYGKSRKLDPAWAVSLEGLPDRRQNRLQFLQKLALSKGESVLAVCGFSDLMHVLENDSAFAKERLTLPRRVREIAKEIRPRVAHPVKLLIPKHDADRRLRNLCFFWHSMTPFIESNDFNDKNGGWPNEP